MMEFWVNNILISKIWCGAIFMDSPIERMESHPDFSHMEQALRCFFVEFNDRDTYWKFFWSLPNQHGPGSVFKTKRLKEDLTEDQHRYFNDATGSEQKHYSSTFTLVSSPAFNFSFSFFYRQHFAENTYAFLGGMEETNITDVHKDWVETILLSAKEER